MDLRLRRGTQRRELGPIADQLPQFPLLNWRDERLWEIPAAQPVRQLGRVTHVVLDPPGVPVQPQRVHQMHMGAVRLQQVRRPVPAIGRLERHLGISSGLRDRDGELNRVVHHLIDTEHLTVLVHTHDH
jgi:hypothetical protein